MVSRPTSDVLSQVPTPVDPVRFRFLDLSGVPLDRPREWAPALIELLIDSERWDQVRLTLQGLTMPVYVRQLTGTVRVLADWPRSGPGHYELRLELMGLPEECKWPQVAHSIAGTPVTQAGCETFVQTVTIEPSKISPGAYAKLLEDLTTRLPSEVAIGLQHLGALSGIQMLPPHETTLAGELLRLRRAVLGHEGRPGLRAVLEELARDHLEVLQQFEHWVSRERVRRPTASGIARTVARPANVDHGGRPLQVLDTRMEHGADVYENRLVNVFTHQVLLRLRALERVAAVGTTAGMRDDICDETRELLRCLADARRHAHFLDTVSLPAHLPNNLTMALIKRPAYRAALEGYLEFYRSAAVRIETPALEAPLENLPSLYQLWGTLHVVSALLEVAAEQGYHAEQQRLIRRDGTGLYVRVLPDGYPVVVLRHPVTGNTIRLIPERTYARSGLLHSITYPQRPDIAVEITEGSTGCTRIYLFDPKYKLAGEGEAAMEGDTIGPSSTGKPQKVDIDKMHAYRDAIRDAKECRVVHYAAILYPGREECYPDGIEALQAYPGREQDFERRLRLVLSAAIAGPARADGAADRALSMA